MKGLTISGTALLSARSVEVRGRIQGVGFRPFLYRLAIESAVSGWVKNCTEGVKLHIEGSEENLSIYIKSIVSKAPAAARIQSIESEQATIKHLSNFIILPSDRAQSGGSDNVCEISPDLAVCDECVSDMHTQNFRMNYLFTNCTNCGPRFSIIKGLPYDRINTTMAPFQMCDNCRKEYSTVLDRRFHAQPNSCRKCGPSYTLHNRQKNIKDSDRIIITAGEIIKQGNICAIKGIGGYHLACDPFNTDAVNNLRKLKKREGKPFAVMFSSISELKNYVFINDEEEKTLTSTEAPIVLLKLRQKAGISSAVQKGLDTLGCFLPYTPFYHTFFALTDIKAIVLTSGNFSDRPIVKDNEQALSLFSGRAEAVVTYNREIYNRCDDSVGRVINGKFRIIRRSRGWVPESLDIQVNADSILAAGGELKNTFCIGKGKRAILSQHIGNLENTEIYDFYTDTIDRFKSLFHFSPKLIVHDLHPDYHSTKYAKESGVPSIFVQHHHAHIASCLAENGYDKKVIGFSFDGTGLGDDGNIWGGEVFICDKEDYSRKYHLNYLPLPGGDQAVKEPWRMAVSVLYSVFGRSFSNYHLEFLKEIDNRKVEMLIRMIEKKINTPLTSSMGRLFDAASALLGLCTHISFDAEGPMRLEAVTDQNIRSFYPLPVSEIIDTSPLFRCMVEDILRDVPVGIIAAKFHNTLIRMVGKIAENLRRETGISTIALSGGVFLNAYFLKGCENLMLKNNFTVLTHSKIPAGDGGLALGQLVIAAKRKEKGKILCV